MVFDGNDQFLASSAFPLQNKSEGYIFVVKAQSGARYTGANYGK